MQSDFLICAYLRLYLLVALLEPHLGSMISLVQCHASIAAVIGVLLFHLLVLSEYL